MSGVPSGVGRWTNVVVSPDVPSSAYHAPPFPSRAIPELQSLPAAATGKPAPRTHPSPPADVTLCATLAASPLSVKLFDAGKYARPSIAPGLPPRHVAS